MQIEYFIADSIIDQGSGKTSLIGFYPDKTLVLDAKTPSPTPETPAALHSISILMNIKNCPKNIKLSFSMLDPSGQTMITGSEHEETVQERTDDIVLSFNSIFHFQPFVISSLGEYTLKVVVNDDPFDLKFKVTRPITSGV